MSYRVLLQDDSSQFMEKFVALPKRLYGSKEITQNESEVRALLGGTHVLSHYFTIKALMVTGENGECVSRCIVTIYPNDTTAYLGLFESENDLEAVKMLFSEAEEIAGKSGAERIVGPVDASFWIKYRLKTDRFGQPYTGEPYNLPYYLKLWQECGYQVCEQYFSNHYMVVKNQVDNEKYTNRLTDKLAEGYTIENVTPEGFDKALKEVYGLLTKLYSSFPVYKPITEGEFIHLFCNFKKIMRYNMVKMAYYDNKPVAFYISVPNYGNRVYKKLSMLDYVRILLTKAKPSDYVMLYMGVDFSHRGLGKAMAEAVRSELRGEGVPSIGALIRKGNSNKDYFSSLIDFEYEYVLLEKEL